MAAYSPLQKPHRPKWAQIELAVPPARLASSLCIQQRALYVESFFQHDIPSRIQQFADETTKKEGKHGHNDRCSIENIISYCIRANELKAIKILAPALYGSEQQKRVIDDAREQKREDIVKILQGDK